MGRTRLVSRSVGQSVDAHGPVDQDSVGLAQARPNKSWQQMTPEEQGRISTLNIIFCRMHLLVGMADVVSSVLLL